jgi:uncharacterized OB-fold protein
MRAAEARVTSGLRATHVLDLAFERSVGGATAAFLAGLARGEIVGSRGVDARVTVPPLDGGELVRVADAGCVRAWSWVREPDPRHPLATPFAFALIQLDGADTSLLHVVDVAVEDELELGMRVRAEWAPERRGSVLDIRAFVPGRTGPAPTSNDRPPDQLRVDDARPVSYVFEPGLVLSAFFRALAQGRIEGGRCPSCRDVYVPPHARCPACGSGPMTTIAVASTGTVTSFTVVHLPVAGFEVEVPFAWARILLDGADVPVPHVIGDVDLDRVVVGQRVEAVWAPADARPPSWQAIRHFRPVTS